LAVVVASFIGGCYLCDRVSKDMGVHDHGGIVWDEFVGFWITMIAVPVSLWTVVLGFILFRVFDIIKPWPIGWLDNRVGGGVGIMIDDVIAGIFAGVILHVLVWVLL
ncbi:MAG TPA: phosphatidylglycerophosphatase A, partial [Saccharospirillum sp.]|nr:phosphatidylglycerophosphatase A [Saccharospirillum sp.]